MNVSDDEEAATQMEGKAGALRQLKEERKALDPLRKLQDELLAKAQEEDVAKVAGNYNSYRVQLSLDHDKRLPEGFYRYNRLSFK